LDVHYVPQKQWILHPSREYHFLHAAHQDDQDEGPVMTAKSIFHSQGPASAFYAISSCIFHPSQSRRAFFASQRRVGLIALRKIFKNNRIIKNLKLIGYILFYIALFFGVIIAINYIEGNGIRSAIN